MPPRLTDSRIERVSVHRVADRGRS
uniref:Uncharacterized protein n=1 Tax=Rhizophora mucronata TaxID=61149 RepID=A0A2P2QG77_RHIMU